MRDVLVASKRRGKNGMDAGMHRLLLLQEKDPGKEAVKEAEFRSVQRERDHQA